MDGREFLDVAERLAQGNTEADWRTATGRAYYGLMQEMNAALLRWGFGPARRDRVHTFVRLHFIYASDGELKAIGIILEQLVSLRNLADYQLTMRGSFATPDAAKQAVLDARNALTRLDAIDRDPVRRAAAVAGIRPIP
jgi:uncharacterized protein (UPF0332 family)